ncbi:ATP-dependent zinc metalloprotease FTSH 1, chloroplastic-like [Dorcoceras hygrometricum]|uniref:ATP-dependent zinc metalloprotease FTSH 1, chloroplastic-like n=1 Tax=Dorcoceras hygrometricum TaxID=472368 RepID=A0A2Z7ACI3_9LAMI|nr:ATP-dependent zinc metalloprotease FTSH 1, chloroplastic-like [Dorcoceras hygrometricum]
MTESSCRGGGKGKSVIPPTRDVSQLNIQDLDFLFDDDENTLQEVEVQATRQQSQGTQGSTSIPSAPTVSMGGRSKSDIFIKHFDKVTLPSGDLQAICKYCSKSYKWQHGGVGVDAQLANLWRVGFIDSCTNDLYR